MIYQVNLIKKPALAFLLFIVFNSKGISQQRWSLQQCVDYAVQNNIQLKQSKLNIEMGEVNLQQSRAALLPTLNGFATHNYNFGRTIDPLTNLFATNQVQSNSFGLNTNLTLYDGMQNYNSIKQSAYDVQKRRYDLEKSENDIRINVINAYLQILFAEELLLSSKNQAEITRQQLERVKKLVQVGSSSKGAQLEIEAQHASEELMVVNNQNQVDIAYLNMVQILNLENYEGFEIERPLLDVAGENIIENASTIYSIALTNQPSIKSAETAILSSQSAHSVAKGASGPRLSLSASYGSGYSQLRKEAIGNPVFSGLDTIAHTISNEAVVIPNYSTELGITPFSNQVKDNQNKTIGFSLSIPVFNGYATKSRVSQARISVENAKYNLELNKQSLRNAIQKSHADATAAYKKFKASEKSVKALKEAFYYTEQRFTVGMVNTIEYNDAKNKLAKAESDLLQAKFDYVFKVKILDYYLGKPLAL